MYDSEVINDESERTAFRKVEKKYKIYYDSSKKKKIPRPVDLSEVIDFKSILDKHNCHGELMEGVTALQCDFHRPIFCLKNRPGFYFIPSALSVEEQCQWIRESLTSFPQFPNRTNHDAIYGPIPDLFVSATQGKTLVFGERDPDSVDYETGNPKWKLVEEMDRLSGSDAYKSIQASLLLRKLRWSTLGLQFDWSKRSYNVDLPHKKIPNPLCQLAKRMAAPAMPYGEEFQPEAAIVNYFGLGDMLGGHLDDMEKDWSKPIVSMSLGCKSIFLLGGKSREDSPISMFLRSGDVVLMAGEARECFHGVPRIFTDTENAEIATLQSHFVDEDFSFLDYIRTSRININIRQVF